MLQFFRAVLLTALNETELKKEIIVKSDADVSTIKTHLVAIEKVRRQIEPERQSYAQAVTSPRRKPMIPGNARRSKPAPSFNRSSFNQKPVVCYNCQKERHISKNCRERPSVVRDTINRHSKQKMHPDVLLVRRLGTSEGNALM